MEEPAVCVCIGAGVIAEVAETVPAEKPEGGLEAPVEPPGDEVPKAEPLVWPAPPDGEADGDGVVW